MPVFYPIDNTPVGVSPFISGLVISYVSASSFVVSAGACSDTTNTTAIEIDSVSMVDMTINGLNGLDTDVIAVSSVYAVYAIASSAGKGISGLLVSLNKDYPVMPDGYDIYRRIGWVITDDSAELIKFKVIGTREMRTYQFDSSQIVHIGEEA